MSRSALALLSITSVVLAGASVTLFADGCGSDSTTASGSSAADGASGDEGGGGDGGSSDGASDSALGPDGGTAGDGACPTPKVLPSTGETCVGFGAGTGCDTACGLPAYGYVCFNGGPPGFANCVQASSTGAFGDTYCCPDNKCVPQPDQDNECTTAAGKPHRYQCPPDGAGGNVAPPNGCADGGVGGSALERFYCCP